MNEANSPITECVQSVCHDTQPWLISFSLGKERLGGLGSLLSASRDPGLISVNGAIPFAQLKQAYLDGKLGELCDRSPVSWINWHNPKVSSMVPLFDADRTRGYHSKEVRGSGCRGFH
jgi:hypothetical protein